ncbi:MAG: gliding motility lipoprotein GldD [Sediminicola sp.]|tara:strand:+ start:117386 stop:117946 length:561 start_codon:yes stop_codon:yes gene_type:complete
MKPPKSLYFLPFLLIALPGCKDDVLPKPKAMLRLEYPNASFAQWEGNCPFSFSYNIAAIPDIKDDCSMTIHYGSMNAAIFISYKQVDGNLEKLLSDAQKLSYEHAAKANNIVEQPFVNGADKVFGMYYEVQGNAASQAQFYATDSVAHFLTGSLYFSARPNYDSILPAADYLQGDVRKIMESLRWK